MSKLLISAALSIAVGLTAVAPAFAQPGPAPAGAPAPPPPGPPPSKDPTAAPAGTYALDKDHQSVVARIVHQGFSVSVVRFGVSAATLTWDPVRIENSKVVATVDMKPEFAPIVYRVDPAGPNLLNVVQFPTATFTSTAIRRTGPATGQITGDLTFRGQTHPATIDAQIVGAGKNARGVPIIGFTGVMKIKRADWGFTAAQAAISNEIELLIDAEFTGPAPPA